MAKRSFCRTANAILGKVGGRAPEDVILELIRSKCLPALLYVKRIYSVLPITFHDKYSDPELLGIDFVDVKQFLDCSLFIDHRIMIIVLYRMPSYLPIVSQSIAPVENMCTLSLVILICLILTGKSIVKRPIYGHLPQQF